MITLVIAPLLLVLQALLAIPLLTVTSCPAWMSDAVSFWVSKLEPFTDIFPVQDLMICLGLVLTFETSYIAFKAIVFVYKRVKS